MPPDEPRYSPSHDREPFTGEPSIYVIASTPRSGSSLLARLLESTGRAGIPSEYFNTGKHLPELGEHWGAVRDGKVNLERYVAEMIRRRTTENGVFGLKAHWSQLAPLVGHRPVDALIARAKFVWIRRRDLLGQALSLARAHQTGQWSAARPAAALPSYDRARIDRSLEELATDDANWRLFFAKQSLPLCEVWYEDLVLAPGDVSAQVQEHLGLEPHGDLLELNRSGMERQADELSDAWRARYLQESNRFGGAPLRPEARGPVAIRPSSTA